MAPAATASPSTSRGQLLWEEELRTIGARRGRLSAAATAAVVSALSAILAEEAGDESSALALLGEIREQRTSA